MHWWLKKHGAKIELWDNFKQPFGKKKAEGNGVLLPSLPR